MSTGTPEAVLVPAKSRLLLLVAGGTDGLCYPLALVCAAPIVVHLSGPADYSRFGLTVLLASVGSLFNIASTQGVIYSLARGDVTIARRAAILTATILLVMTGVLLFGLVLPLVMTVSGAKAIFPAGQLPHAALLAWLLCALVNIDGLFGGVLKAVHRVTLTAPVELAKGVTVVASLWIVSRAGDWQRDCICLVFAVASSACMKILLSVFVARVRPAGLRAALKELKDVARINSWQWLLLLSAFLFQQADRLIIAARLGAAKFAMYNFYWQSTFIIHAASAAGLISVLPLATAAVSRATPQSLRNSYARDTRFGFLVATLLVMGALLTVGMAFHFELVPAALRQGLPALLIMISAAYLAALAIIPYYYMIAFGGLRIVACVNVVAATLAFLTALGTAGTLGITGLALSKLWGVLPLSYYLFCHSRLKRREAASSPGAA